MLLLIDSVTSFIILTIKFPIIVVAVVGFDWHEWDLV